MSMIRPPHLNEICLQVDDLLDAFALDALDLSERRFVEDHLAGCLQQRDRLAELEEVLAMMGQAVTPLAPPPAVWERLVAETRPTAQAMPAADARPAPMRLAATPARPSNVVTMNRWVAWAGGIAAALLLASTVALGAALQGDGDDEVADDDPIVEMVARGGQVVPLSTQPQPEAISEVGQGSILLAPGMTPAVVVDHWTPTHDALKYIVWMAEAAGGAPTVLGEIKIDEDGNGILLLNGVTSFEGYGIFGISIQTTEGAGLQDVLLGDPTDQSA